MTHNQAGTEWEEELIGAMNSLEEVRVAIVKAVPELGVKCGCDYCLVHRPQNAPPTLLRPIRLADVLKAIHQIKPYSYFVDIKGAFWKWKHMNEVPEKIGCEWNLAADNLDNASEETIAFLHSVLCV